MQLSFSFLTAIYLRLGRYMPLSYCFCNIGLYVQNNCLPELMAYSLSFFFNLLRAYNEDW